MHIPLFLLLVAVAPLAVSSTAPSLASQASAQFNQELSRDAFLRWRQRLSETKMKERAFAAADVASLNAKARSLMAGAASLTHTANEKDSSRDRQYHF